MDKFLELLEFIENHFNSIKLLSSPLLMLLERKLSDKSKTLIPKEKKTHMHFSIKIDYTKTDNE